VSWTIKAKEQHSKQKGKSIIKNPEIQATVDKKNKNTIQKTEVAINNIQSRDTGNIEHKTERRQKKQKHNTEN
jgi:phage terminase small subunit